MKTKHVLLLILVIFSLHLFAGNITLQEAKKVALNFYFEKYNQFEVQVRYDQLTVQSVYTETDGIENYYYVFHFKNGGFVIVSADDCLSPVLGYSFKINLLQITNHPMSNGGFRQFEDQVKYAKKNKLTLKINTAIWAYYLNYEFYL